MDKIMQTLEEIDLTKLVPDLDTLLGKVQIITTVGVIIGPIIMLILGLWYFFLPVREANHYVGFRSWFGMGSVEVWRFTQRMAGLVWGGLGLILTVIMGIICLTLPGKEIMEMVNTALVCLAWQAGLAVLSYLVLYFLPLVWFTPSGQRR